MNFWRFHKIDAIIFLGQITLFITIFLENLTFQDFLLPFFR